MQANVTTREGLDKKNSGYMVKHFFSEYGVFLALAVLVIIISALNPSFLGFDNIMNLLRQVSINAILAIGMTYVILSRGIDLSVGSILAFSGIIAASFAGAESANLPLAIILGIGSGLLLGLINGFTIAKFKVTPFIVTLGMMAVARGFTFIYSDGTPISNLHQNFLFIGGGQLGGIPFPVWITVILFIIFSVVLYKTTFGRHVYAIGGSETAAKISGIKVNRSIIGIYGIMGLLAGIAGVILTSRVSAGLPQAGTAYELDAIAAVVIGGTSLMGGRGRLWGSLIGAIIIGVLNNGLDLLGVSSYWQQVIKGCIIVFAVMLDRKRV
ncbi:ribose ABC transporter permease [Domibacillus sp. DTU_2020_1001157_1_SI_ALB_TIR_016]|uniref:ABC transporter permease n=1 Tax=Domibacillus sp. DTU_2020_1001157_1_SI_ALB_TIR_016 TaxID=3077789 RepID=UPI0028EB8D62|nr:ribose ABC transporter permease [Domibacillus sp. DTU_2020_1001157_1_SI_ALB_TIR_016]WNS78779.1 ribose ABC transporter permease [Domibacillus sp. DTU_2020_1001157_1_SI_ALB_TIR_016]